MKSQSMSNLKKEEKIVKISASTFIWSVKLFNLHVKVIRTPKGEVINTRSSELPSLKIQIICRIYELSIKWYKIIYIG